MNDIIIGNDMPLNEIHKQMSERLKAQRSEQTDRSKVKKIPIGRDHTGKTVMGDYVPHYEAQKWLDEKYPGWSWEVLPESFREYGGMVIMAGRLTVYEPEGMRRVITCYGSDEINIVRSTGMPQIAHYAKIVESDAFKRCCVKLGWAFDVYSGEELDEPIDTNLQEANEFVDVLKQIIDKLEPERIYKMCKKYIRKEIKLDSIINFVKKLGEEK